jgi:hypothetical protein
MRESIYYAYSFLAAIRVSIGHDGITRRAERDPDKPPPGIGQSGICLVASLTHCGHCPVGEGRFTSNSWGPLVEMRAEVDESVLWLHLSTELQPNGSGSASTIMRLPRSVASTEGVESVISARDVATVAEFMVVAGSVASPGVADCLDFFMFGQNPVRRSWLLPVNY